MDDLAVARGNAAADAGGLLGDDDLMAGKRGRAGDGKTDDAGPDHQNLHGNTLGLSSSANAEDAVIATSATRDRRASAKNTGYWIARIRGR